MYVLHCSRDDVRLLMKLSKDEGYFLMCETLGAT